MDISLMRLKPVILLLMVVGLFALTIACGDAKEIIKEKIVEKVVEVEKIVPGPTQIVEKIVPGPTQIIEKIVPGPTQIIEKIVQVAPPEKEKRELVFAGLSWDSAMDQNGVARYIVEHGYGYPTSHIEGDTVPLFQGLREGSIDITMEIWLPNQNAAWEDAIAMGQVIGVGKSLEDNWQNSFLIPGYLADAHPGLVHVDDLKKDEYKSLFTAADSGGKAVLVGCLVGWACLGVQQGVTDDDGNVVGVGQIEAYGLSDHVFLQIPGSFGALNATIEGAYTKENAILHYYWGPTALAHKLDMRPLEQPAPASCPDEDPVHGCGWGPASILIAINPVVAVDAPELIPFLANWDWNAGNQLAAEGWRTDNKEALENAGASSEEIYSATGVWYLKNHEVWKEWIPAEVVAKVEAALAKED
ncbi:MAG: hypothetical protein BZY81_03200 [SAR202 cluster bacterium Io17-Chloro-G4]|nr:MAG: hypothetical protein BZY81_03200 [SAR202 cluster bacterium Io17-Chloro-G4]